VTATRHGLTVYDGAYVATGERHGWTLVSGDVRDLVAPGRAVTPDAAQPGHYGVAGARARPGDG